LFNILSSFLTKLPTMTLSPQQLCCFGLLLVLASLPTSYAQWSAGVKLRNSECSKTLKVSIGGKTYTLSPGQSVDHTLCSRFCTGILGACKDYSFSLSATI